MRLVLSTYESIVCTVIRSIPVVNVLNFIELLKQNAIEFAKTTGVSENQVNWYEINESNWCKNKIVLYAVVPIDWEPTPNTLVLDDITSKYATTLSDYIRGTTHTKLTDFPPRKPHNLFHTT